MALVLGLFLMTPSAILIELALETCFPVMESLVVGILISVASVFGVLVAYIMGIYVKGDDT